MSRVLGYPVTLTPEPEGGFTVTFKDIPEAITQGETVEDSLLHAKDVLESAMEYYLEDRKVVPAPSKPEPGQLTVALPSDLSAKVLRWNQRVYGSR